MRNVHILPTDKPSRLYVRNDVTPPFYSNFQGNPLNIYITSDEEIKNYDYCIDDIGELFKIDNLGYFKKFCKKIILTTDADLIKDGIQAIPDDFLEWFVAKANDSGKPIAIVEIGNQSIKSFDTGHFEDFYKIIIPKEETIEEAAERLYKKGCNTLEKDILIYRRIFIAGAKWQQERIVSNNLKNKQDDYN